MSLRHALLGMLQERPSSGYDLLKRFDMAMAHVWTGTQSQLYGELAKLQEAGLIRVHAEGPRGRTVYEVTDDGRAELRHWLVDLKPGRAPRNDVLLRVYFLGSVAPEQAREYLAYMGAISSQQLNDLTDLEASIDWTADDASPYGHLVLEWGKRFAAMQREWVDWATDQVSGPETLP
ncbi:PadR family transcriptional regulator [Actinoplanes sp. NPDC049265]|uniref:PadR family transcriptional regulator n=1 Tax=Actinoplanes sp. NPDC049265 TaxID=3363902 RepID=UPI00371A6465